MKLRDGSRVAVIGGGPAGSLFSMFLLRYAGAAGLNIRVDVYEWRSFSERGPKGCNRCAGVLSASMLRNLRELDLVVPEDVVRAHITSYHLHSPFGVIDIANPDPEADILSVFRGGGPLYNPQSDVSSFDGFLDDRAVARGANLVRRRVEQVRLSPGPQVVTEEGASPYDLVALATGLNSWAVEVQGLDYRPPATLTMSQDELYAPEEHIKEHFGNSVRVFLFPHSDLVFGSIVPKGPFLNVSLLGKGGPPDLEGFLEHELVRRALPFKYERSCGCRPRISVGLASNPHADGFVCIGDSVVSRLYKDGIGSALLTARQAATVAVQYGITGGDFERYYAPFCRAVHRDNRLGKILFDLHHYSKDSSRFFRAHVRLIDEEREWQARQKVFSRIVWGMFTGSYTYRQIWGMLADRKAISRLAREYVRRQM